MRFTLDLPVGVIADDTTFSTPGRVADANNMRWRNGRPEAIGGWSKWHSVALTGTCRNATAWADDNGAEVIAFGTHTKLQVLKDGALYDITPTDLLEGNEDTTDLGGIGDGYIGWGPIGGGELTETWPRTWSLSTFGKFLVASPRSGSIYTWALDTATPAAPLANAPLSAICSLVTDTRQVMALGCEEEASGDFNAKCIRGSDVADTSGVGLETWNVTTSNNAFEFVLEGPGVSIVSGTCYQDIVLVWTEAALYLGRFQDVSAAPWTFDVLAANCGLIGPNAFTVTNEGVYWLSPDKQFFFYQYGGLPQIIPCMIRDDLIENIVETDKIVCAELPLFNEIWWFYADGRDGDECSRWVSYNTAEQAWSRGNVARTAAVERKGKNPLRVNSYVYLHEDGTNADGAALDWHLKTSAFYIDESGTEVKVSGVKPDFQDQENDITLTLYGRSYPQASETEKGSFTLAAGREKRDFRARGKIFSMKFAGTGRARFGTPVFEFGAGGRR